MEEVELQLSDCGHKHKIHCHRKEGFLRDPVCSILVDVEMPVCKHKIQVKCGVKDKIKKDEKLCTAVCGGLMACGHKCYGTCGRCIARTLRAYDDLEVQSVNSFLAPREEWEARMKHSTCLLACGRNMFCGHSCRSSCHGGAPNTTLCTCVK